MTPASIRAALAERRILKYEFAHLIGIHPQRLGAILNERAALTPALAEKIAEALAAPAAAGSRGR